MKLFNFLRNKPEAGHPLGSDAGVQEAIDALPVSDPGRRLDEIGDWIADSDRSGLDLAVRARAYARLDEAGREAFTGLAFRLLAGPPERPLVEQCWAPLVRYARQALRSYCELLRDNEVRGDNALADEIVARSILRGLHAAMSLKKWLHMKIQMVPPELYGEVYWLFQLAERKQLLRTPLKRYPDEAEPVSIQQEFVAGIAFEVGPWQNFSPAQMEAFDLLLRKFAANLAFRGAADRQTGYAVSLAGRAGPVRLQGAAPQAPGMRFLGTGIVLGLVVRLLKHLQGDGSIPDWLALPGKQPPRQYIGMLQKLQLCWSNDAADRRRPRTACEVHIEALHGFREIRRMLASIEYVRSGRATAYRSELPGEEVRNEEAPDPQQLLRQMESAGDRQLMQQWIVIDRSETGLGVRVPRPLEWLKVGALIGFRQPGSMEWALAIVRRLSRNARGQMVVGMELFGGELAVARAGALDRPTDEGYTDPTVGYDGSIFGWHDAVVLRGASTLLLPQGRHADGARFLLNIGAEKKYARLTELREDGSDYCLSHYEEFLPD